MSGRLFRIALLVLPSACGEQSTLEIRPRASLTSEAGLAGLVVRVEGAPVTTRDFRPGTTSDPRFTMDVPDGGTLDSGRPHDADRVYWE